MDMLFALLIVAAFGAACGYAIAHAVERAKSLFDQHAGHEPSRWPDLPRE